MRVAFCLYGQPRKARHGHATFCEFLQRHRDVTFDFYFHAWHDPNKTHYDASPWRPIPDAELRIDPNVIEFLCNAYLPVDHRVEPPKTLDIPGIRDSILYRKSDPIKQRNLQNSLSQIYSKQAVRNLVVESGKSYDLVIASRFDFLNPLAINLREIDTSKLYVPAFHLPRALFSDALVISNPAIFSDLFNVYENLPAIMNNADLLQRIQTKFCEPPVLTTENVLFANFVMHHAINQVVYTPQIPDFH